MPRAAVAELRVERRLDRLDLVRLQRLRRDLVARAADALVVELLDLRVAVACASSSPPAIWLSLTGLTNAVWIRVPDLKSMPKFRPLPPIASAPTSRIVPDSEKNHFEAPMKSNVQPSPRRARSERRRVRDELRAAHRAERRLRREHRREQRHERADAEREREALDFRRRQREQDERGHERDDVRVDDRREAALVAGRDAGDHRSAAADLLLHALEDHDVRVRRDADRQDQPGDPRQRQRDRDQLDQRVEVDRRRSAGRRSRSRPARGRRTAGTGRRRRSRRAARRGPG